MVFSVGTTVIQVWDLYSGLELQIFRPVPSLSSAEDHHITALAAGTVHGHQVCIPDLHALLCLPSLGLLAWMLQHGLLAGSGMLLIVSAICLPVSSTKQSNSDNTKTRGTINSHYNNICNDTGNSEKVAVTLIESCGNQDHAMPS